MRNVYLIHSVLFIVLISSHSCKVGQVAASKKIRNFVNIYNPAITYLHPKYKVYHNTDTTSLLYIRIPADQVLYTRESPEKPYKAYLDIRYKLYKIYAERHLADTMKISFTIPKKDYNNLIILECPLKTNERCKYFIEIQTNDKIRNNSHLHFMHINKRTPLSAQNFMVVSTFNNQPYFYPYMKKDHHFTLRHNKESIQTILVSYFKQEYDIPPHPYVVNFHTFGKITPDSIWSVKISDTLHLPYRGMYYFQADTAVNEGFTLFNFGKHYPLINTPAELIKPLKYIASKKEYREYISYSSKKLAVDKFWLNATGNIDRAKENLKVYYNRAMLANIYFTSYKEGWKTERGMIFIIFGLPTKVLINENKEKWIYGENLKYSSLSFTFMKQDNPYTQNDYVLNRSEYYSLSWNQAIDTWRNGRIFAIVN